jgi:hypothetical protein
MSSRGAKAVWSLQTGGKRNRLIREGSSGKIRQIRGKVSIPLIVAEYGRVLCKSSAASQALIGDKKECMVLKNWSAERASKNILMKNGPAG